MRSAIHERFGDPAEVLAPGESPLPEPGKGEVRVRMRLAPIHNHDLFTIRGQYGWKPTLPAIGGSEGCGVVDAVGEGVEGFAKGQRVNAASGRLRSRAESRARTRRVDPRTGEGGRGRRD